MSQTRDQQRFTVSEVAVCALNLEIWEPQEPVTSTLLFLRSIQITVVVDFIDRNKKSEQRDKRNRLHAVKLQKYSNQL